MSSAYELGLRSASFIADCDLSLDQYKAVKMSTSETIILASDANDRALGVLQDTPAAAGRGCLVALGGITKAIGGAAINAGAAVEVGAGGKFVTLTTGPIAGIAVSACGGINQQFSLDFFSGE
jgi:hypothetical protein